MPDLVIFDCDGVLIDSEILSSDVLIGLLAVHGVTVTPDEVRRQFLGRSFPTVARTIREDYRIALPPDFEAQYRQALLARFETELHPTPGISGILENLEVPFCVATSSSPPRVTRSLAITGLDRYFGSRVFTASQVANGKPAPDLFLLAASEMGARPGRCLVIEDSRPGILAANAAGMAVLVYRGASHLQGIPVDPGWDAQHFDDWADFPHLMQTVFAET